MFYLFLFISLIRDRSKENFYIFHFQAEGQMPESARRALARAAARCSGKRKLPWGGSGGVTGGQAWDLHAPPAKQCPFS